MGRVLHVGRPLVVLCFGAWLSPRSQCPWIWGKHAVSDELDVISSIENIDMASKDFQMASKYVQIAFTWLLSLWKIRPPSFTIRLPSFTIRCWPVKTRMIIVDSSWPSPIPMWTPTWHVRTNLPQPGVKQHLSKGQQMASYRSVPEDRQATTIRLGQHGTATMPGRSWITDPQGSWELTSSMLVGCRLLGNVHSVCRLLLVNCWT